ncbi:MAG: hypothetical protein WAL98_22650, partial [Desulfatiglandaceae bacterium]
QNNLAGVTDAENHTTTYIHDDLGRLGVVASPDTGTTTFFYDAAGNLVARKDANGNTISYRYDKLNRLTAIYFSDSTQDIAYTYDQGPNGKGRLTAIADPTGSYAYGYNALGLLENEERTLGGHIYSSSYTYDPSGLLTAVTYPSGRVVSYERDSAGNLTKVTITKDGETRTLAENMAHLPFGPLAGMTYGNGMTLTQTFDQLYRLTHLQAGSIENLTYSRDPFGNILSTTDQMDAGRNQNFSYDDLYQLTSATNILGSFGYTYDRVGNRLTRTLDGQTDVYSYAPGTNRLTGITGDNPETFSHDANGNTTAVGDRTLIYNQNNRLIRVTENGTALGEYLYNGRGERAKKITNNGTVYFLYDKEGSLMAEADSQGTVIREYIYAEGSRLAMIQTETPQDIRVTVATSKGTTLSGIRIYTFDASGNYTGQHAVTDDDGTAVFPLENFSNGTYTFRADYLGYHFWSQEMVLPDTLSASVLIEEETTETEITVAGTPEPGVKVYLFAENGSYLGLYRVTNELGSVSFELPVGQVFKFRADYLSNQYWSDPTVIAPGETSHLTVDAGGGVLTITAETETGTPLAGLKLYLFSPSEAYLGSSGTSDENGQVSFRVSNGSFKVRADYLGYKFWTDVIPVNSDTASTLTIPHQDVTATVNGNFNNDILPFEGLNVHLFTPEGSYLGVSQKTDGQGQATFNLPSREYKLRVDYLSRQYWSDLFTWEDRTVTVPEGLAEVTVTSMGFPLAGIRVYVFNPEGKYLGLQGETGIDGVEDFRLPEGVYNFRADYMGSQYWSGNTTLIPHVSNPVNLSTGGGVFTLNVLGTPDLPLESVPCYLFRNSGAYLGIKEITSSLGEVGFN